MRQTETLSFAAGATLAEKYRLGGRIGNNHFQKNSQCFYNLPLWEAIPNIYIAGAEEEKVFIDQPVLHSHSLRNCNSSRLPDIRQLLLIEEHFSSSFFK